MKIPKFGMLLAGLAALGSLPALRAVDNDIRVDVIVDMTDAGEKVSRPTPEKPAYYFPWTAGYIESGAPLNGLKPPPPTPEVQRMLAKALAEQGYLVMNRKNQPSLVLIFWWGYLAPIREIGGFGNSSSSTFNGPSDGFYMTGVGISAGTVHAPAGQANQTYVTNTTTAASYSGPGYSMSSGAVTVDPNSHEMFLLVAGDRFEEDLGRVSPQVDEIHTAATHPRYFLIVSALDFKAAIQKKPVLLWCARVSTELQGRNLEDVLPTLIDAGAKLFGTETGHPKFATVPAIPMGRVLVGTPVLKTSAPVAPGSQ